MTVTAHADNTRQEVTVRVHGRFDFNCAREFRQACDEGRKGFAHPKFVVDLGDAEYMDSSALGMLLMLREQAGNDSAAVRLTRIPASVRKVLEIANFQKLFAFV